MTEITETVRSLEEAAAFCQTHVKEFIVKAEAIMMAGSIYAELSPNLLRIVYYAPDEVTFWYRGKYVVAIFHVEGRIFYRTAAWNNLTLPEVIASLENHQNPWRKR